MSRFGRATADGSRTDVVMSGVVKSGRESGHDNVDANDPYRISRRTMTMVSAARAPGGATASINADEIEAEGGSPSSRVSEVPTFRLHGKFMSRARLVHSK